MPNKLNAIYFLFFLRILRNYDGIKLPNEALTCEDLPSDFDDISILPPQEEIFKPSIAKRICFNDGRILWRNGSQPEEVHVEIPTSTVIGYPTVVDTNAPLIPEPSGKKRRRRRVIRPPQRVDNRQAINGSIVICHDELLYSSSGWQHFQINHPLMHYCNSEAIIDEIFTQSVGGSDFGDIGQQDLLIELLNETRTNHRKCRYGTILKSLLKSVPSYDRTKASVETDLVFRFIKCVFNKVFPVKLLGGVKNRTVFLRNVSAFIEAGYRTSFTLSGLNESMSTKKVLWLAHLNSLPMQQSFLARSVKWLMVGWLKPLIRQHFYATESAYARNRIFFYNKDVWQRIHSRMMRSMTTVSLRQHLPSLKQSTDNSQLLLNSRLRFVPKRGDSCRPIMSTKFPTKLRLQVTHARLLLQAISCQYVEGMDAKSTHTLHRKWVEFLNRRSHRKPIYFVHADIEDAFGSINQQKLVEILEWHKNQLPPAIALRTLCTVSPTGRRSKNFNLIPHLLLSPEDWVRRLEPGTVVFDVTFDRSSLLNLKIDPLMGLAVRSVLEVQVSALGSSQKCHYRLERGIPQGSKLSSPLCHIYYGHMVKYRLSRFLNDEDFLVRVVDDFLYLTTCGPRALDFYTRIHQGFPDYNAYVNDTKTRTNVDIEVSKTIIENEERPFPLPLEWPMWPSFCGLQFNSSTMEIRGDYDRYKGLDIIHSISQTAGQPGQLLLQRVQGITTLKIDV